MLSVVVVTLLLLIMATLSGYALFTRRRWGELIVSSMLWLTAIVYAALVISPLTLFSPAALIIDLFGGLFERFFGDS
jgi:ABC-type glycerol-3-phosphate transport system permease component